MRLLFLSLLPALAIAQTDGCGSGFFPGTDTVIYTVPYTYTQVLSIIGSYKNLTWSGNPDNTVTLNGTDNTIGTARMYKAAGANVTETLTIYSKPPNGPYVEAHVLAPLTVPSLNLSFYSDYDANTATPICNGMAVTFNETVNFCATNASLAAATLHLLHLTDVQTVGQFLGGQNFTSCAALAMNSTSSNTSSSTGMTPSGTSTMPASFTGSGSMLVGSGMTAILTVAVAFLL